MTELARQTSNFDNFSVFFEGELMGEADLVFRLAYAYTLNREVAFDCVRDVYKGLVKDLPELVNSEFMAIRHRLFKDCLRIARSEASAKPSLDRTVLGHFLASFSPEERGILIMNELGGLSPGECATIMGIPEIKVRKCLGKARHNLVAFGG